MIDSHRFELEAKRFRNKLWLLATGSLVGVVISFAISEWAGKMRTRSWEAFIVEGVFQIMLLVCFIGVIGFPAMLVEWHRQYPAARTRLTEYDNWKEFKLVYRWVLGPVPWM